MIGNDIVDLSQAAIESNWKRPRFLNKVFTKKEQLLIRTSEDQDDMVWLLWSMKEAAYKAYVREFKQSFFNPKRIQCQLSLNNQDVVCIDNQTYNLQSIITSDYIHSIASKTKFEPQSHFFKVPDRNQSEALKTKMIHLISGKIGQNINSIEIKKTELGVPNLFINNQQIFEALSISHHGKYGAFAIC
ncbi:4'-phosphopantetheinyl transferase superfamily protein [Psychroserpens sp.]|uniref:4'-phosphopantetheinyl transferase family protein n=1 Tax=Psychroserpens sp. TaxID=2020870 RepID=UPI002B27B7F7|nr:4'-phosphopantetheinyl transferase superfamily protein [Psychroserpens sp.]